MGYYYNSRIANVDEPKSVTLAGNPNFVTFSSKVDQSEGKPMRASIQLNKLEKQLAQELKTEIRITKENGESHSFFGVYDSKDLNNNSFLLVRDFYNTDHESLSFAGYRSITASVYNLQNCLLNNNFIRNNFEVRVIPQKQEDGSWRGGDTLEIESKGCGKQYNFTVKYLLNGKEQILNDNTPDISLFFNDIDYTTFDPDKFLFWWATEPSSLTMRQQYELLGSSTKNDGKYFLIEKPQADVVSKEQAQINTLENLMACMRRAKIIDSMVDITLNKAMLRLEFNFKGQYKDDVFVDIDFDEANVKLLDKSYNDYTSYYVMTFAIDPSETSDSFDYGVGNYQIALDIYTDTGLSLGVDDKGINRKGTYLTTLSKSYFAKPLWFEINTLMSKRSKYSNQFLTALEKDASWVDAGTVADYYFLAKRFDGFTYDPFYCSDVLYTVNGYDYTLSDSHLDGCILDLDQDFYGKEYSKAQPLTSNFVRTHAKGQRQYFNFILKNSQTQEMQIALHYKLYTQSGMFIGEAIGQEQSSSSFNIANTALLDLDRFLPEYNDKTVGRIDVYLTAWLTTEDEYVSYKKLPVSEPLTFRILPEYLHPINDFAFLNRKGGWDSFNFAGSTSAEFKSSASTIYKTLQPGFSLQSELESVSSKTVQEQFIAQTSPINSQTVEWLRELSASPTVYELSTKRYVIVDDLTLKHSSKEDLYQVEMKYHYSDTFNAKIK